MRRRRQKLQVTTFPFLAVLLCTLGVLIMLLLILDQRSRLLAQQKAEHDAAEARHAARDAQQQRQADAERQTAELNKQLEELRGERAAVQGDVASTRARHTDAAARINAKRRELDALERWLQSDEEQIARNLQTQQSNQAAARQLADRRSAAEAERDRVRHQLSIMEQAAERLHEAAGRRPPLYSLAPYRGKHGTQRQPIYLECVGERLIFQPEGRSLSLAELGAGDALQTEIEARFRKAGSPGASQKPYALLMIRPSGIALYYAVLRALRKSDMDVGYEFIDEDWQLDFKPPSDAVAQEVAPPAAPRTSAERPVAVRLGGPEPSTGGSGGAPGSPGNSSEQGTGRGGAEVREGEAPAEPIHPRPSTRPPIVPPTLQRPVGPVGPLSTEATGRTDPLGGVRNAAGTAPGGQATNRGPAAGASVNGNQVAGNATGGTVSPGSGGPPRRAAEGQPARADGAERRGAGGARPGTAAGGSGAARDQDTEEETPRHPRPVRAESSDSADQRPSGDRPNPVGPSAARPWVIVVECSAEHVVLEGREPLKLESARWDRDGPVLLRTLQERIEQKKARFPEQRPQLKFQIHADGLRAYYQAAGTLRALNLPVNWELLPAEPKGESSQR